MTSLALALVALAATPLPARDATRSVYDEAGVIDAADEATMEAVHRELASEAGVGLVVVTVPRLVDETIEALSVRIGAEWGVGTAGRDEGVVIALALEDREIHVASGYGAEAYLPDGKIGALLDQHVLPSFKAGDFGGGILNGVHAVLGVLKIQPGLGLDPPRPVQRRRGRRQSSPFQDMLTLGLFIFVVVMCMISRTFRHLVIEILWYSAVFGGHGHGNRRDHFGSYSGGSGFGGFGGGSSGGGGASRGW